MAFMIFCEDDPEIAVPDDVGRLHRDYIGRFADRIRAGGPILQEDADVSVGRALLTTFESEDEARAFLVNEPLFKLGRVRSHIIMRMIITTPA